MSEISQSSLILRRKISFSSSYLYSEENPIGYGHNMTFEVFLRGEINPKTGLVVNLTDIKPVLQNVISLLDHKNLRKDVEHFQTYDQIQELNILDFILDQLKGKIKDVELVGGRLYFLDRQLERFL